LLTGTWPWREVGEKLSLLLDHAADLSAADNKGQTPLHYLAALGGGNPLFFIRGIGDTFIAAKVDINLRDQAGDTPLHIAARTGTRDVFDWLVKQGADLDATNNAGETPRRLAHNLPPARRAAVPTNAAPNGQLLPRVDPTTGQLVYTDHWGDTPVRDVSRRSRINYLGTTLALEPNGTNLEVRLLTAIFDSSAKEFPDDNGFNFSIQVRSSTNESSPQPSHNAGIVMVAR
jgi:ankyrin repeat protein